MLLIVSFIAFLSAGFVEATGVPDLRMAMWPAALLLVLGTCVYVRSVRALWDHHIRFARVDRSHPRCPSHLRRPSVRRKKVASVDSATAGRVADPVPVRLASKATTSEARTRLRATEAEGESFQRLSKSKAQDLDMDHLHISWVDFLWAYLVVAPSAAGLALTGLAVLLLRQWLHRIGCPVRRPCDPRRVVGRLLLESMEVVQYECMYKDEASGAVVARFRWKDFAVVQNDGSMRIAETLVATVDVDTKRMVSAALDGRELDPSDAMVLIFFHSISSGHAKLHALANWGVNHMLIEDRVLQQCAIVTAAYNFFGRTRFPTYAKAWYDFGVSTYDHSRIDQVFDHGVKAGIRAHPETRQLMPHSDLCNFVVKVRRQFIRAFEKYEDRMLGIDMEALFVGTVLHSLDHQNLEWNIEDPLWFAPVSPDFAAMAEFCRLVRVGFVEDIWSVPFARRFREASHPFFKEVYERGARINKRLADHMDICITK
uniref:Uncharacterized protein n=1 Tax=Zooxanthella nutricula TaxID=1333877 RepID=A0A7S2PST0_9DINO|mmetsp:Transcript_64977/g.198695  ORF Transcript_64977/g.198695 Transcript_64977/m.198695 type:complete len:485 (+) Transcript_64977:66-1520(+)|eukprot:CAMPEP_0198546934 /NCGR_PEP_ID=MMETSP1462-20131121/67277_1 /TAXON_ID=1333877 /ORGANISM="Brandtodinium nutriculum, Strain RCC3387" /LENGTH=484 /DNA_ID=CAMNT_0044277397 /DNA_START=33 /DNA_END=1487 /DNA_ORIENTATION=+